MVSGGGADSAPPASLAAAARRLFGSRLPLAIRYAELLSTEAVLRGLVGPREAPRIWQRHLLNCAVVADLIRPGAVVVDVGSGAGLPGVVLAVARPDLSMTLVEPLARRAAFLAEVVADLGLVRTKIARARAEDVAAGRVLLKPPLAQVVTARALAPLDRLAAWCLPLVEVGGRVLAIKGSAVDGEIAAGRSRIGELGGGDPIVRVCGAGVLDQPTTVVEIVRERPATAD